MEERDPASLRLPASQRSPRLAREYAERFLRESGHETLGGRTALIVSELVTNAMVHTREGCTLRLRVIPGDPPRIRIEVDDPVSGSELGPTDDGKGLRLVAEAASSWGVERQPDHKTVWAELA